MAGKTYGQHATDLPLFNLKLRPAISVMDAIHDLPELKAGEESCKYRNDVNLTAYERKMRQGNKYLTLHKATNHTEKMLRIINHAGYNRNALPKGMTSRTFSSISFLVNDFRILSLNLTE